MLSSEFHYRQDRQPHGPVARAYDVALLVNGNAGRVRLRGEARIGRGRGEDATGLAFGAEIQGRGPVPSTTRGEIAYEAARGRGRLLLGHTRRVGPVAIGFSAEVATNGRMAANLSLSFSLGMDKGAFRMRADPIATRGATHVSVFRDLNQNGRQDPGEPAEPGVRILGDPAPTLRESGADGALLVDGLIPWQPTLISVDASSLSDPFLQPVGRGVVIRPRPGVTLPLELPLVPAGGVEGTLVRDGRDYAGVALELITPAGQVIARATSDYDGYFVFDSVPYGNYTLRVEPGVALQVRAEPLLRPRVELNAQSPSLSLGAVAVISHLPTAASKGH